jgi:hypothetical protein
MIQYFSIICYKLSYLRIILNIIIILRLDRVKNNIRIEKLRIINEDSEKNSDFSVKVRIVKK